MAKVTIPITVSVGHLVAPKPTALVTCIDERGQANIITIAAITVVSHRPPIFMIAVRQDRYSHALITKAGEFVINMPPATLIEATHRCGRTTGRRVNKFEDNQLTPVPSTKVKAPLIEECPINIECKVVAAVTPGTHTLFMGEVVVVHVEEGLFDGVQLDLERFPTILFNYEEYRSPGTIIKAI
jgi:flavin reductase (DIM6/NTAB) family NADH-FMN oxidoreductase RutF